MNSQSNKPIAGPVMDGLSASLLMTQPDTWIDRDLFEDCISVMTNTEDYDTLFERARERGVNYIREFYRYELDFIYLVEYARSNNIDLLTLTADQFRRLEGVVNALPESEKNRFRSSWLLRTQTDEMLRPLLEQYELQTNKFGREMTSVLSMREGAPTQQEYVGRRMTPVLAAPAPLTREERENSELVKAWRERYSDYVKSRRNMAVEMSRFEEEFRTQYTTERAEPVRVTQYSGRLLFSALLPRIFTYTKGDVVIQNGILLDSKFKDEARREKPTGIIARAHIGAESGSIVHKLYHDYGKERAVDFLTDHPFVTNRWITQRGFTVGWGDCHPEDPSYRQVAEQKLMEGITKTTEAMNTKVTDPLEEERLEKKVRADLDVARTTGQTVATEKLSRLNNFAVMAFSGAKGTTVNVGQITSTTGQQTVGGKRMPMILSGGSRCLPHFARGETDPRARGLCPNAFGGPTGLTPAEVFFLQTMGREGILDTAMKTGQVGYLNRRVIKTLENVKIAQDGSVRDAMNNTIQEAYGDDGFDPAELERVRVRGQDVLTFVDVNYLVGNLNAKYGYFTKKPDEKSLVQEVVVAQDQFEDVLQEDEEDNDNGE